MSTVTDISAYKRIIYNYCDMNGYTMKNNVEKVDNRSVLKIKINNKTNQQCVIEISYKISDEKTKYIGDGQYECTANFNFSFQGESGSTFAEKVSNDILNQMRLYNMLNE